MNRREDIELLKLPFVKLDRLRNGSAGVLVGFTAMEISKGKRP